MAVQLKTTSLPDAVCEALRESIVTMRDEPGATLTEHAVALRYGVARPTARAAIERLVSDGILRRDTHRAARVPVLTADDIDDLYATRLLIEDAALRDLAARSHVPGDALVAHRALLDHNRHDPGTSFARIDGDFHRALVLGHHSPRLSRMHGLIMGEIELCIGQVQSHRLFPATEVAEQHRGILDAVAMGDIDLAAARTRAHILTARDRLLRSTATATATATEGS